MRQSLGKKREKKAWKAGRTREEPVFEIAANLLLEKTHLRQSSLYPNLERDQPEWRLAALSNSYQGIYICSVMCSPGAF